MTGIPARCQTMALAGVLMAPEQTVDCWEGGIGLGMAGIGALLMGSSVSAVDYFTTFPPCSANGSSGQNLPFAFGWRLAAAKSDSEAAALFKRQLRLWLRRRS